MKGWKKRKYRGIALMLSVFLILFTGGCGQNGEDKIPDGGSAEAAEESSDQGETEAAMRPHNRETIYEGHGIRLELSMEFSPLASGRGCYLISSSEEEDLAKYELDSIVVNDVLKVKGTYGYIDNEDPYDTKLSDMSQDMQLSGIEEIRSLSFHLILTDDNYDIIEESDQRVEFDRPLVYAPAGNLEISPEAEGMILADNDDLRMEIVYCGTPPGAYSEHLFLVIAAQNRSDYEKNIYVENCTVNGMTVEFTDNWQSVPGGQTGFIELQIYESSLENLNGRSIREMNLQISTYAEGYGSRGEWYELNFADDEAEEETDDREKILFDSWEDVSIYLLQENPTLITYTDGTELIYCWDVLIENRGDTAAALGLENRKGIGLFDGEVQYAEKWGDGFRMYLSDTKVGRKSTLLTEMRCYVDPESPISSLSASAAYYNSGETELLHIGSEVELSLEPESDGGMTIDREGVSVYPSYWGWDYDEQAWSCWSLVVFNETEEAVDLQIAHIAWDGENRDDALTDGNVLLTDAHIEGQQVKIIQLRVAESLVVNREIPPEVTFVSGA